MKKLAMALALLFAAASAAAQTNERFNPSQPPPLKRTATGAFNNSTRRTVGHIERGDRAPDFDLALAGGGRVKLSSLRGQWAVVCFCPQRTGLESVDSLARTVPEHVTVLGIFAEKSSALAARTAHKPTRALLLDDATGDIAALYGAYDLEKNESKHGYVIVDPKGVVYRIILGENLEPGEAARAVQYAVTGL